MVSGRGSLGLPAGCGKPAAPAGGGRGVCRSPNRHRGLDTGLPGPTQPGHNPAVYDMVGAVQVPNVDRPAPAVSDTRGRRISPYSSRQCVTPTPARGMGEYTNCHISQSEKALRCRSCTDQTPHATRPATTKPSAIGGKPCPQAAGPAPESPRQRQIARGKIQPTLDPAQARA